MTKTSRMPERPVETLTHAAKALLASALAAGLGAAHARKIEPRAYSNARRRDAGGGARQPEVEGLSPHRSPADAPSAKK